MYVLAHLVQLLVGVVLTLTLLGWCLYRLAIWFRLITVKKKPTKRQDNGHRTGQAGNSVAVKGQRKPVTNISRRMLYTARRERN
ncbi:hypothetical protein A6C57_28280 (plasmid) [Fibrella sp. ES10-3-2-2]